MIYLLSEMILALAVAIVLGIAIGWVIHRSSHSNQIYRLKRGVASRNTQLAQAHSDIAMLTDDYDDLHRKSQEQIDKIREENRQIPSLSRNLEKSQLLVRQMMQRHEGELRDINNENQKLKAKLAKLEQQSQVKNELAANPDDRIRSNVAPFAASELTDEDTETVSANEPHDATLFYEAEQDMDATISQEADSDDEEEDMDATIAEPGMIDAVSTVISGNFPTDKPDRIASVEADSKAELEAEDNKPGLFAAIESDEDPFDTVIEVANDMQLELDHSADTTFDFDSTLMHNSDLPLDGSTDSAQLFQPVDRHDDLQQIFGIGPLTEKALNELGITSYSQLAELKQHDVQRIADALEIGQGRIERDNWVGNARRQLEDVLENL